MGPPRYCGKSLMNGNKQLLTVVIFAVIFFFGCGLVGWKPGVAIAFSFPLCFFNEPASESPSSSRARFEPVGMRSSDDGISMGVLCSGSSELDKASPSLDGNSMGVVCLGLFEPGVFCLGSFEAVDLFEFPCFLFQVLRWFVQICFTFQCPSHSRSQGNLPSIVLR